LVIKKIEDASAGTTVGTYTISGAKKTTIPFPPLPEQYAIAAALNDMDALIDEFNQLITKKRDLRQAAMQELLTGKKRLAGFSGKWESELLSTLIAIPIQNGIFNAPSKKGRGSKELF
jgi:type I restriction enzyme S subunit